MTRSEEKFGQLLTVGVHHIHITEFKPIKVIQDELGYAIGRDGGTAIEYWRKGHIPPKLDEIESLAREIVRRGGLERNWLEQFLYSAGHPNRTDLADELFGSVEPQPEPSNSTTPEGPAVPAAGSAPASNGVRLGSFELDPFTVGPPLLSPRQFFGRTYELKRIFGLWRRLPLQNVAVIGLKRSGKTSLLHYINNIHTAPSSQLRPEQKTTWLPQPERYRWIFVDFQDARMCNRERLFRYLLGQMDLPVPDPCNLNTFMDVVSERLMTPTIILMDEINAALASPELDQPFWNSLRSLGCNFTGGNLGFVLTSDQAPAQLAQEQGKPSPFFNIFGHSFTLGPLKDAEAHELIANSPRPFPSADVAWILAQSGCWPLLLQILCHVRLAALEYDETGPSWKQEGLRQIAPYRYLLNSL